MSNQIQTQKIQSGIAKYKTVILLAVLPVILALYANNADTSAIPFTLSSGIFAIAFTLLSWGMAASQYVKLKKK